MVDILSKILAHTYKKSLQRERLAPETPKKIAAPPIEKPPLRPPLRPPLPYKEPVEEVEAPPEPPVQFPITVPPPDIDLPPQEPPKEEKKPSPAFELPKKKEVEERKPWFKRVIDGIMKGLDWVEGVDAASFGLIRALWHNITTGVPIDDFLGVGWRVDKEGKKLSKWAAARESVRELGTAQRLIGEMIFSPFNLLMVVPSSWAGRGLARMMSGIAKAQIRGRWWTKSPLVMPIRYSDRGLHLRLQHRLMDWSQKILEAPHPQTMR
jgi:hypothetical protein